MTLTHLFLVRHGETDYNRKGIVQGRGVDTPLNEKGLQQAQALARRMTDEAIDAVHSSPLTRALQTARCVAESCGVPRIPTDPAPYKPYNPAKPCGERHSERP